MNLWKFTINFNFFAFKYVNKSWSIIWNIKYIQESSFWKNKYKWKIYSKVCYIIIRSILQDNTFEIFYFTSNKPFVVKTPWYIFNTYCVDYHNLYFNIWPYILKSLALDSFLENITEIINLYCFPSNNKI